MSIISGSINTDERASAAAAIIRGDRTPAQKREDAYYAPPPRPDPEEEAKKEIWDALKAANESNTVHDLDYTLEMIMNFKEKYYASQSTKFQGKYSTQITRLEKRTKDKLDDMEISAPGNATKWESKYSNWRREISSDDDDDAASAAAMSKPSSIDMTQWNGPTMSRTHKKPYYTRKSDGLAVWGDRNTGELTQTRIDEAETHKAKKAAKKGGKRKTRRKKRRKKKKSRKKKGGRLEKLGLKISEILKRLRDLEDDVIFLGGETRSNGADIRGNGGDITENAVDIGVIKSYINYKLNNTLENAATPLDQWQGHLRSIDRRSHQEPPSLIDIAILRDANMRGGKRKKRKTKRKRKKRKKRKRKSKKRHRKKKGGIAHAIIKAQVWPANYTPAAEVANPQAFREPTWMRQL